jgi:cell division protein FtsZ
MQFDIPKEKTSIIKVIGVGGGGSNAVNHMYRQGIKDVDFIVCNTDRQVLDSSPVPLKIQLGATLTEGLGAGALPEMGRKAALENEEEIKKVLDKTKMLFITAGMGGGTGTGAAPVIARIAQEMGILTVSICTLPFTWEGKLRRKQAEVGLNELKQHSDSVLVILNDKLREIYHNLKVTEAFAHADNVLSSAAKCIAELINVALTINVDFNDVKRVMEKSGVAIMGSASAMGEGRALKAVTQALNSPLLNDNDIKGARYVLVSITCGVGKDELTMDELAEITDYVQEAAGQTAEMIKGYGTNDVLGDKVSVTVIASGFEKSNPENVFLEPLQEIKMVHLNEAKTAAPNVPQLNQKVELAAITEPILKSNTIQHTAKVHEAVEPLVQHESTSILTLKRVPEQPFPAKPIEVKFEPVITKSEEYDMPVPSFIGETTIPHLDSETVENRMPQPTTAPAVVAKNTESKLEEELSQPSGTDSFFLAKDTLQTSIEFDLTASNALNPELTKSHSYAAADAIYQPAAHSEQEQPNENNMNIKRDLDSSSSSGSNNESKVTKIADIQLNNIPPLSDNEAKLRAQEKIQKLRELSFKVKTPGGLSELENEPAYKRKNIPLTDVPHSSESEVSRLTLGTDSLSGGTNKTPSLRPDNSFLHDKPD